MGLDMVSRRGFLSAATVTAAASTAQDAPHAKAEQTGASNAVALSLEINGRRHELSVDPRITLLDLVREQLGLTGAKKGCDHGQCGACTVLLGGRRVLACLTLAASVRQPVVTIEGLAQGEKLHPMQQAFIEQDAFQCGYCTPGQILSAVACLAEGHARTDDDIREYMSGNLCRCAAYPHIVAALRQVRDQKGG